MNKKELEKYSKSIIEYGKSVSSDRKKTLGFLNQIGVTDKDGKVSRNYKKLCTHLDQV